MRTRPLRLGTLLLAGVLLAGCQGEIGAPEAQPTSPTAPSATPAPSPSPDASPSPSSTPTATAAPTPSPTPTPTASPSPDATASPSEDEAAEEAAREAAAREAAERAAIEQAQARLAELGYYDGAIDGQAGPATTAAVRGFQAANGLSVDGVLGPNTSAALSGDDVVDAAEAAARRAEEEQERVVAVEAAQQRLRDLGYYAGPIDGELGARMHHAVMAFQKVNGLSADGQLGPATSAALDDPRQPPLVGGPGTRVEVDLDRQVVHVIQGGRRVRTINASSGNGETFYVEGHEGGVEALTPVGTFTIQRRIAGLREGALGGMYDPMYFYHGWALHGSNHVPAYPASHGCVRMPRWDASWLFGQVPNGTTVVLHGSRNTFVPGGPDQPPIL